MQLSVDHQTDFIAIEDLGDGRWQLNIRPGFDDSGDYAITLRVTDGDALADEETFGLRVLNINRSPVLAPVGDIAILEGQVRSAVLAASDPDGDAVTFEGRDMPAFVVITENGDGTANLNVQPGFFASGIYSVTVSVSDSHGQTDETTFVVTVGNVNRAPSLAPITSVLLSEGESSNVSLSAVDPDGDAVEWSVTGLPAFAVTTDDGDGNVILGLAPSFFDSGTYPVLLSASDGSLTDEMSLVITVEDVNRAPVLGQIGDIALDEDETLVIPVSATDPDGDSVALSVLAPPFMTLTDNGDGTGSLSVGPDFSDGGTYQVTVVATDSLAAVDEIGFSTTVGNVNRAPVLGVIGNPGVAERARVIALFDMSDPDGDNVVVEAEGLPAFVTLTDLGDGWGYLFIEPDILDAGVYTFVVRITDTGVPSLTDERTVELTVHLEGANQVAHENSLPGTEDWHLDSPALAREIEGYASATSVNRGDVISLFVNTLAPTFTLEVFRTGWYQGIGARRVLGPIEIASTPQITPMPDPVTGLVEANWVNPYEVLTHDSITDRPWTTGVYLARLTESVAGKQSYIIFVVREDDRHHNIQFQLPVTTYQAYNPWGGKSLHDFSSGFSEPWGSTSGARASHVSFDRPYARHPSDAAGYGMGAGEYLTNARPVGQTSAAGWNYNMVRWLEHEQYDVAYVTSIDTHRGRAPTGSIDTEVFLSQGHDEYWSWEMRDNIEDEVGWTSLAFFSSGTGYTQVRFEPSPTTATADRVMIAYQDAALDPVFNDADPSNDHLTTVPFRDLPVPRPEEELVGVQYVLEPYDGDIIVTQPAHLVFSKTGFVVGSRLTGLLGYKADGMFGGGPLNLEVLAETPIVSAQDPAVTGTSHMTVYDGPHGDVFATGTSQWSWGLDDYNAPLLRTSRLSAAAQQITANVLGLFGATPRGGDVVEAECIKIVSLSDATNSGITTAAEFDVLDDYGYPIPKEDIDIEFVSSEDSSGPDRFAQNTIDDNPATFWQTEPGQPHEIGLHVGYGTEVTGLHYLPRQDFSLDGTIVDYEIYRSTSFRCDTWDLVAAGSWETNSGRKIARFSNPATAN